MHVQLAVLQGVIVRRRQSTIFVAREFALDGVITADSGYVSCKGREPTTKKDPRTGCYQLVKHPVKVAIHILDQINEIFQVHKVIVFSKWFEKRLVALISANEYGRIGRQTLRTVPGLKCPLHAFQPH